MAPKIAIIGSGFGGLAMAIALGRRGVDYTVFERCGALGGTWRDNVYPGAACDIQSHLYSFSFEPKPDWTRSYAEQPEILGYLEACADKYGVRPRIVFDTEIVEAVFDEPASQWRLGAADGRSWSFDAVVAATGQLHRPKLPRIEGLERLGVRAFHSARWDGSFDPSGKRVGVVGTGASAIQIVPRLAPRAARLEVFQQSPPWILPKPDRAYPELERRLYTRLPALLSASRALKYLWGESRLVAFNRQGRYNRLVRAVASWHLERAIADPVLRARLTPDYPLGCNRILISNDYYPVFTRPNVELVVSPIVRASEQGLVTADGRAHALDAVVLATGFETTHFLAPMRVFGRGGRELEQTWRAGAEAYLGMMVSGFPNLFVLYGPNTNLAHNSIVLMLEAQAHYVTRCLAALERRGARVLEPKPRAMREFSEELRGRFAGSIWEAGCSSWYKTEAGRNTNNWPGFVAEYWYRTRWPRADHFAFDGSERELERRAPG